MCLLALDSFFSKISPCHFSLPTPPPLCNSHASCGHCQYYSSTMPPRPSCSATTHFTRQRLPILQTVPCVTFTTHTPTIYTALHSLQPARPSMGICARARIRTGERRPRTYLSPHLSLKHTHIPFPLHTCLPHTHTAHTAPHTFTALPPAWDTSQPAACLTKHTTTHHTIHTATH